MTAHLSVLSLAIVVRRAKVGTAVLKKGEKKPARAFEVESLQAKVDRHAMSRKSEGRGQPVSSLDPSAEQTAITPRFMYIPEAYVREVGLMHECTRMSAIGAGRENGERFGRAIEWSNRCRG